MSDTLPGIAPALRITCPYCDGAGSRLARDPLTGHTASAQCIACSGSGDVPTATVQIPPMTPETLAAWEALSVAPVCTCGTLVPCDAHETADDRREAMRKIREKMTTDLRFYDSHNGREVTAEEAASAARVEAPEMVTETVDGAVHGRSGRCL